MVSVLHKELEYKVEKLGGHVAKDLKIYLNFQLVNKPSRISSVHTKFYSRDWSIQSIIY